jgi:hypothetical protein
MRMGWTESIDLYCERTGPELWSEPANAVTNLAFFLAAWAAVRIGRRMGRLDAESWTLIALVTAVGIGSTLFHTFGTRWASAADTTPILLFILAYLGLALRRWFGARRAEAAAVVVAFPFFAAGLAAASAGALPPAMQGVPPYIGAFAALAACAFLLVLRRHPAAPWLGAAALIFAASLTARTLDLPTCAATGGWGAHWLWHVLNGALLGTLLHAWLRLGAPVARAWTQR